ncbi:transglycosylase SLT domain-containing protein [Serratia marcescens]|uniref:transglycosylase SLT domain-containing protein n=1 Tax=Serratia marcescens TaxID=615 RepID=UPI00148CA8D1|nr:transglycosylase SLT domain-containing protein [Serratia marcescens]QJU42329.1 transglycosylase SLT domain-containing protein [Serratia marcescens]
MRKLKNPILFTIFFFCSSSLSLTYANCWSYASQKFGIEARLLASIAQVESGMNPEAIGKNKNGTIDVGIMQINSIHFPRLNRMGIDSNQLQKDPCLAVIVGASILSNMMQVYGYGWEAVGAFNAGTAKDRHDLRIKYAKKVWAVYSNEKFNFY